jgi:flagellar basal-body rod protein FlgG
VLRSLYSAASGMMAQQANMDTISNNLANVNTTGFKKGRAEFQDLLYAQILPPVQNLSPGISIGQGARLSSIQRIFSIGQLEVTDNPFDLAIQGEGFFKVRQPDGKEAYTRDGAFRLDDKRRLVTANGDILLGRTGPIVIPQEASSPEITPDGIIRFTKDGTNTDAGRITITTFTNPSGLTAQGNNLWAASDASGTPQVVTPGDRESGRLGQSRLETSNVQSVEEMVNLITAQRAYEINSKVIQSADEMMGMANSLRRG